MSKRLLSNEPEYPKVLEELSGKMRKSSYGGIWKDKKSYKELSEAAGIPSGKQLRGFS